MVFLVQRIVFQGESVHVGSKRGCDAIPRGRCAKPRQEWQTGEETGRANVCGDGKAGWMALGGGTGVKGISNRFGVALQLDPWQTLLHRNSALFAVSSVFFPREIDLKS